VNRKGIISVGVALALSTQIILSPTETFGQANQSFGAAGAGFSPIIMPDETALNIVESFFNTGEQVSRIDADSPGGGFVSTCDVSAEQLCGDNRQSLTGYMVLPPCQADITQWCIDGLSIYKKSAITVIDKAKLLRQTDGPIVRANPKIGLPQGGTISLWNAPGVANSSGSENYAVYTILKGSKPYGDGPFVFHDFSSIVIPYSELNNGRYQTPKVTNTVYPNGQPGVSISGESMECGWTEVGKCGLIQDFSPDTRVKLSIRIGNSLSGWLMGRMVDPSISVSSIGNGQNLLEIDSKPAVVPKFYKVIKKSSVTQQLINADPGAGSGSGGGAHNVLAGNMGTVNALSAWEPLVDSKADALFTAWSISTTTTGRGSNCLTDTSRLLGVVSTNAMTYEGQAPAFINNELRYQVAGLHLNPDGSVFSGSYDLIMRSDTARCLYGFTKAPVSASVSIVSQNGSSSVTTALLSESSGWLHLGVNDFHFSNPMISVKFDQSVSTTAEVTPTPTPTSSSTPTPTPSPTPTPTSSSTPSPTSTPTSSSTPTPTPSQQGSASSKLPQIRCMKGKAVKVIVGKNAKCPAGYVKK